MFHVLDPAELEFPFDETTLFEDSETNEELLVDPRSLAEEYQTSFTAWREDLRRQLMDARVVYRLIRSDRAVKRGAGLGEESTYVTFLSPALLIGLIATVLPLIIHLLLRRKPKRVIFPSLEFILKSHRKTARRFKIRQLLLMLSRCVTGPVSLLAREATADLGCDQSRERG